MLRPPIAPMLARSVPVLPEPVGRQDLRLEPKWDGFRVVAFCRPDDLVLQSRAGRLLTPYFPDIVKALLVSPMRDAVVDGELLVWDPRRHRTDFALLQQRITAGGRLARLVHDLPATLSSLTYCRTRPVLSCSRARCVSAEIASSTPSWIRRPR